jgi:cytoplasmic iron level regulating protein YaaA (DUF328/UPF0246 family)
MSKFIAILSPAKTLDMSCLHKARMSNSRFTSQTELLASKMKECSSGKLATLMKISDKLSQLNVERWQAFGDKKNERGPAAFCFQGHVYKGLDASTLDKKSLDFSQDCLRILSGLYGLLRPLDKIQAYRLEMGTGLKTDKGKNLYEFWGDAITDLLHKDIKKIDAQWLLNLASQEYCKVLNLDQLGVPIVDTKFLERSGSKTRFVSFSAKTARGLMARWVCMSKPKKLNDLKKFHLGGYQFDASISENNTLVFVKNKVA